MKLAASPRAAPIPVLLGIVFLSCARGGEPSTPETATAAPGASTQAAGAPATGAAPTAAATVAQLDRWPALVARLDAGTLAGRFVQASGLFLDVPYADGPLGEGEAGGPDPDPRVDFDRADCVTYLEQSLALALCRGADRRLPAEDPFLATLDRIRYRDGIVGFVTRNHYTSIDWIPANAWLVEDVTDRIAKGLTVPVTRTIDRAEFLRERGVEPRTGLDDACTITRSVVPRESLARVAPGIASGDLVFWVGKKDGILIVHTGLALRDAAGRLWFRHASSRAGKVTEEPLADYAARATFAAGFLVLRLREDASP